MVVLHIQHTHKFDWTNTDHLFWNQRVYGLVGNLKFCSDSEFGLMAPTLLCSRWPTRSGLSHLIRVCWWCHKLIFLWRSAMCRHAGMKNRCTDSLLKPVLSSARLEVNRRSREGDGFIRSGPPNVTHLLPHSICPLVSASVQVFLSTQQWSFVKQCTKCQQRVWDLWRRATVWREREGWEGEFNMDKGGKKDKECERMRISCRFHSQTPCVCVWDCESQHYMMWYKFIQHDVSWVY